MTTILKITEAKKILTDPLYAGMIVYEPWGVTLRKGQHEGVVSYETFRKIQERLSGRKHAPNRADLNNAFPLRGSVACSGCNTLYTSCWSRSCTGKEYPYYICQNRKCEFKGKSIGRAKIEGQFETLLSQVTPGKKLVSIADEMFRSLWDHRLSIQNTRKENVEKEARAVQDQINQLLDKIVDANSPTVIRALEKRVDDLEQRKLVLDEKRLEKSEPKRGFDEMYRTAMDFLSNPLKIWENGKFEDKRAVAKLLFSEPLVYCKKQGYRTPNFSLPFKVLEHLKGLEKRMVPRARIELALCYQNRILNPARLPVPPPRHIIDRVYQAYLVCKAFLFQCKYSYT